MCVLVTVAILDGRQKRAEELKRLADQSASLTEEQLSELRADIKVHTHTHSHSLTHTHTHTRTHTHSHTRTLVKTFICSCLMQRFSIPVLAPHRSAHFVCYSYHFRRLFYSNASALRSGHHTIFLHDSSSKRTYSIHSALKCARREFKLYIFTDVYDVTLVRA